MHLEVATASPLLAEIGFRKRAGGIFTKEFSPGILGWLGLNRATKHRARGEVEVNPVVGVRFQEVERLVAELCGIKFHEYVPPTVATPLGYVLPNARYTAWLFEPGTAEQTASDMVKSISVHGVPFMQKLTSLDGLCAALDARTGVREQIAYRRPVAAFLAGDANKARELLDAFLAENDARTDPAATSFRRFARAFRHRMA